MLIGTSEEYLPIMLIFSNITRFAILVNTVYDAVGRLIDPGIATATVVFIAFATVITVTASRLSVNRIWPLTAACVPLTVGALDRIFPFLPTAGDAAQYDHFAWIAARHLRVGDLGAALALDVAHQVTSYAVVLGSLYAVGGRDPLIGVALNSGLWGVIVLLWLSLAVRLWGASVQLPLGVLFLGYPAPVRFMSTTLRESVALFFTTMIVVAMFYWLRSKDPRGLALAILTTPLLAAIRVEIVPPLFIGAFIGWLYRHRKEIGRRRAGLGLIFSFGLGLLSYILSDISRTRFFPSHFSGIENLRKNLSQGSNAYLTGLTYDSWFDLALYLPVRLFYFMFSPFPWVLSSYALFLATADALFTFCIVCLVSYSFVRWRTIISPETVFLLSYAVVVLSAYALVVSAPGATSRRRLYAMPVLLLIASYGLARLVNQIQGHDQIVEATRTLQFWH